MNKAKLKSYAPQARKDFIAAVTARANLLGLSDNDGQLQIAPSQLQGDITLIAGQPWPAKVHGQRQQLIARLQKDGFAHTCEAVAYTWFNRFAALRYMELHDYLGHGHRALSSAEGNLPDILTHAADLAQAGDSGLPGLNAAKVLEMKLAGNRDGELYRMLLVAQCNALSTAMPFLFERIDDDTELLLPDNLLRTDSVIAKLVQEIPEGDWAEVEIIGWLYQFYISEKKDQVIGKVVKSEDIPAATQLFTPNWIVQYLVQNSVGHLWLMANPASTLASQWPYYIQPAEQTPEVQAQLDALIQTRMNEDGGSLNPETITVLDPACGSGHILVVAYDVLKAIYLERGYQARAIPRLILEKNLYGLDIDDRAAQMAGFALLMKARADDRRLFNEPPKLNVLSLQESKGLDATALAQALNTAQATGTARTDLVEVPQIQWLIDTFEHAKTFGSLIQIGLQPSSNVRKLLLIAEQALQGGDLYAQAAAQDVLPLLRQALVLGMQFDAVVANPPYMGGKAMPEELKGFALQYFKDYKTDLFSIFVARIRRFGKSGGLTSLMTPFTWMYLQSFEEMRKLVVTENTLASLIEPEYHAFFDSAFVPICAFSFVNEKLPDYVGDFIGLSQFYGAELQSEKTLEAIANPVCDWRFRRAPSTFSYISGIPIAYWASEKILKSFLDNPAFGEKSIAVKGLDTCDNDKFVRRWYEPSIAQVNRTAGMLESSTDGGGKWFLYCKGGPFRRWAGNVEHVVEWENDGQVLRNLRDENGKIKSRPQSTQHYFRDGITFGAITSADFSCRFMHSAIFGGGGNAVFSDDIHLALGLLNSKLVSVFTKILNPTLNMLVGDILRVPFKQEHSNYTRVKELVMALIALSSRDWDEVETSVTFERLSFANMDSSTSKSWESYKRRTLDRIANMRSMEEENNQLFIDAYGLQDELSPEVPEDQITLARADREKDCQRLISYAIGCMMGRYSLDEPGLIYAHAGNVGFDASRYATFPADADGIVPLTDELWFTDDAASRVREFLLAVWGADTLEENMAWLAESLGKKSTGGASETPDETIRRYLADKFFKDHLQTYKKRPIYWLFSSGKQGAFQALVYLHRYTEGTLARLRAEYVVPLTGKLQARIVMLEKDAQAASSTAGRNKLAKEIEKLKKKHVELLAYDEQLRHYADMRITLDLDDGVKVNYGKFGDLLEGVKAVTGGANED